MFVCEEGLIVSCQGKIEWTCDTEKLIGCIENVREIDGKMAYIMTFEYFEVIKGDIINKIFVADLNSE